ncbi:nitrilase-related carbon-nitrogen hydrolase, partial [Klebsiella pneumoniae]
LTLERYRALTEKHWGVDLIVWPETAVPVWYSEAGDFLTNLEATSEDAGSGLILGVPVRDAQGNAYNAAVSLGDEPDSFY